MKQVNVKVYTYSLLSLFCDLKDFEQSVWERGQNYFSDTSDELYTEFLQDNYFFADGKDYLDIYESI